MLENFGDRVMKRQAVSIKLDNDLLEAIGAIGAKRSDSSRTETIIYLLSKAVYLENEKAMGSTVQLYIKEALDNLTSQLKEHIDFTLEELDSEKTQMLEDLVKRGNIVSLANLLLITNTSLFDDCDINDIREEALRSAKEIEES